MIDFLLSVPDALRRALQPILWIALAYVLGVVSGAVMAHSRSAMALEQGDRIVAQAGASDPSIAASRRGFPFRAALFDFAGNLGRGAIPNTVMGLSIALPFPVAAYRGWVGGIVSVDREHRSSLGN